MATTPAGIAVTSGIRSSGPVTASKCRSTATPIWYASVHPALSYGGIGGPPGYRKSLGWSCGSIMSSTCERNACADWMTQLPLGIALPLAVKSAVARCTTTPDFCSACTNLVAVGKSGCVLGRT